VSTETQSGLGELSTEEESALLRRALAGNGVRALFQPVVRLDNGDVVAYEALVRGPVGTELEQPDRLFAAARRDDLLAELDWACRAAAWRAVEAADLPRGRTVLVNVEPETLGRDTPPWAEDLMTKAGSHLRLFVEITERALALRPAELLASIERLRARGWGIALDDVGADHRSLALMPFLRPDVIKLDLRLVQANPDVAIAGIVNAVNAEKERSGAVVLAEGIEHEGHLTTARALGATLGQGWHFGRPDNLPVGEPAPAGIPTLSSPPPRSPGSSPCQIVGAARRLRPATKPLLHAISLHLERQAATLGGEAVVLGAFEHAHFFTGRTAARYARLAEQATLVVALGQDLPAEPLAGVRGADLDPDDPVAGEWDVVVVSPHFAAALVARDLGDQGPDPERRFDYAVTYDRSLVMEVARDLMRRVKPLG
jgi:EAL domain-containing protein (putative c-di-GMP-specific phosphodiesterase class I)